jgi:hypothetical protein
MNVMRLSAAGFLSCLLLASVPANAQSGSGPFARISFLRPHDGATTEWEAGYIRHLGWHRQANDRSNWYGYTEWSGEHMRWFLYATFGHSAESLSNPVDPAGDERDTVVNIIPHVEFMDGGLFEYMSDASHGDANGIPTPLARLELTTIDLKPGTERSFEAAIAAKRPSLKSETLWYRAISSAAAPRYVRLRPKANIGDIIDGRAEQAVPASAANLVEHEKVEILTFRPTMSYNVPSAQ